MRDRRLSEPTPFMGGTLTAVDGMVGALGSLNSVSGIIRPLLQPHFHRMELIYTAQLEHFVRVR